MRRSSILPIVAFAAATALGGGWPTFHGDYSLTGHVTNSLPTPLSRVWRVSLGDSVDNTPVSDGARIFAATDKGIIAAFDLEGRELWKRGFTVPGRAANAPPTRCSFAAPLLVADFLLVAVSSGGNVFALDPRTGADVWTSDTGARPVQGSPSLVDGADEKRLVVVLGQENGALHALDITDGASIWTNEGVARCDGHVTANKGRLAYGSCAATLHLFNGTDGALDKEIALGDGCEMAGGIVLTGTRAYAGNRSGTLAGIDVEKGNTLWVNDDGGDEMFTTPAVAGTWVVFATADGTVQGLDAASGKTKWRFETAGSVPHSPAIAGDKVVAAMDGQLYLLDLATGRELWSYEVSDEITGPAIVGELVVVGTEDGSIWAFGPAR